MWFKPRRFVTCVPLTPRYARPPDVDVASSIFALRIRLQGGIFGSLPQHERPAGTHMTDTELRELCRRFFDAYQDRRVDEFADIYARDCIVWHNVFGGREMSGGDNLAALPASYQGQRRRSYNDRTVNTFHGDFVQQHTLLVTHANDFVGQMDVCFVAYTRDGMISRIYEYFDTGQIDKFLPPRGAA
jgi:hypothetical protein